MKKNMASFSLLLIIAVMASLSYAMQDPEEAYISGGEAYEIIPDPANIPAGPKATAISPNSIVVGWNDTNTAETGYQVQRKKGACSSTNVWNLITTTTANITKHTDTGLTAGTQYSYRIRAAQGAQYSSYSGCTSATTGLAGTPEAPSNVTATSLSAGSVTLTWSHSGTGITGFNIFRKTDSGAWTIVETLAASARSFRDNGAVGNTSTATYSYIVKAINSAGASPPSNTAVVPFGPAALSVLKAMQGVNLKWQDKSLNETGFQIVRRAGKCSSGMAWSAPQTVSAGSIEYNDLNAAGPMAYKVRSTARSSGQPYANGYSMYSNCVEIDAGGPVDLPETGQKACYNASGGTINCAGTGQDGALRSGISWPSPRFVAGTGAEADCMTDRLTGLVWPKNANISGTGNTWQGALNYANSLTYCGHDDWRLPNRNELLSLVNREEPDTGSWLTDRGFSNVQAGGYWSSTTAAYGTNYAWYVNMLDGLMDGYFKGFSNPGYHVWPVRGGLYGSSAIDLSETGQKTCYDETGVQITCAGTGQDAELLMGFAWPVTRFVSGAGSEVDCMTDTLTGLMWPKNGNLPGNVKTWQEALNYANSLTYCGHDDWRLPNISEIGSLENASEAEQNVWLNSRGFNNVQSGVYWSSTTSAYVSYDAWGALFWSGKVSHYPKTNTCYVWPVRAGK